MSNNTYRRGHDREAGRTRKELEMGKRNRNDVNITLTYEVLKKIKLKNKHCIHSYTSHNL